VINWGFFAFSPLISFRPLAFTPYGDPKNLKKPYDARSAPGFARRFGEFSAPGFARRSAGIHKEIVIDYSFRSKLVSTGFSLKYNLFKKSLAIILFLNSCAKPVFWFWFLRF